MRRPAAIFAFALLAALLANMSAVAAETPTSSSQPTATPPPTATSRPPVLAYYYIWYDATSWNRAKQDYPLLGRYSSDEKRVVQQQLRWAKQSGIDGLIVSWKHTERLDHRLRQLVEVAQAEGMKLSIIYQGLDFNRRPLPAARIGADLDWFRDNYASDPVFDMFGKPMVVWSGTWEFSPEEIGSVTASRRADLLILASERNPRDYARVATIVDGDAYYWSSVNPATYPRYSEKLQKMAEVVHANQGLWIAPFAPGFDARLLGKKTVVERRDGANLREQWGAALNSSPDALGLISWNEFSENSHVEPSHLFGHRYLDVLADITGAPGPTGELDSSAPAVGSSDPSPLPSILAIALLVLLVAGSILVVRRRQATRQPPNPDHIE